MYPFSVRQGRIDSSVFLFILFPFEATKCFPNPKRPELFTIYPKIPEILVRM